MDACPGAMVEVDFGVMAFARDSVDQKLMQILKDPSGLGTRTTYDATPTGLACFLAEARGTLLASLSWSGWASRGIAVFKLGNCESQYRCMAVSDVASVIMLLENAAVPSQERRHS